VKKNHDNIESVISLNGIKLHLFEPSHRKIWTVVGKDNEHWLDPDLEYCSCEDYYYNEMEKGLQCYHLYALKAAIDQNKVEVIKFQDSEFENFISALVQDLVQ
jgi:predicted nucleic acid-binding Zn finger protein